MKLPNFLGALLYVLLSVGDALAERNLPADLQIDLLFPRNETYEPAQYFPIIFGINNLDAVWPLNIRIEVLVRPNDWSPNITSPNWQSMDVGLTSRDLPADGDQAPGKRFFHFPTVNMTNGTTNSFNIVWRAILPYWCFANETSLNDPDPNIGNGGRRWKSAPGHSSRLVQFSTAQDAQRPDIEATINSCPELDDETSTAIRITDVKSHIGDGAPCPVLETIKPTKCAFQSSSKELAANVSAAILHDLGCGEGDWQTITAPCPRKTNACSMQIASLGMGWTLLVLVVAASTVL
ncbi:hypothetical protein DL95DRAFT_466565 [Leptodontidium sp. 2 PMI_412]|nr:hypothetical protein DL95DRAFT_466565 [Leptodontidium sp. 2 PMI_412]